MHAFKTVTVGSQASGQLQKLYVALGDRVTKGQLLAEIDPTIQQNELQSCEVEIQKIKEKLKGAEVQLKFSGKEYKRYKALVGKRLVANSDFEKAETTYLKDKTELDTLKVELNKAQIALNTAKVNLSYTKITAPIDGVVSEIITEEGQTVVSKQVASSILVLQDLSQVTIKAKLPEAEVAYARPGQQVYFSTIGQMDQRYYSTLRMIEPAPTSGETDVFSDSAVYYFGLFEVENAQNRLKPGMTVEVSVVLNTAKDALIIPVTALGEQVGGDRYYVKVLTPWRYLQKRAVTIGDTDNDYVQVKSGLREGEVVVLSEDASAGVSGSGSGSDGQSQQRSARKQLRRML